MEKVFENGPETGFEHDPQSRWCKISSIQIKLLRFCAWDGLRLMAWEFGLLSRV